MSGPFHLLPEDAPFIAAIRADPRSDAPRLVYADRLLERGDPLGELIAVQCELERGGDRRALQRRERELLALHEAAWRESSGVKSWFGPFHRGFIDVLHISLPLLREHWSMFSQLPLTRLRLEPVPRVGDVPSLRDVAWVVEQTALEELAVETTSGFAIFDAPALRAALSGLNDDAPIWAVGRGVPDARVALALRALDWRWPDPTMTHDFVRNGALPRLERLTVRRAERLLPVDVRLLMAAPALASVHHLAFSQLASDEAARMVLGAAPPPKLTHLTVSGQTPDAFGPDASRALHESALVPPLVMLATSAECDVDVLASRAPRLTDLLFERALSPLAVERLVASPLASRLRVLSMFRTVPPASAFPALDLLVLVAADIGEAEAERLVREVPAQTTLAPVACTFSDATRAILETRWFIA